jgi:hypothetical protein
MRNVLYYILDTSARIASSALSPCGTSRATRSPAPTLRRLLHPRQEGLGAQGAAERANAHLTNL